MSGRTTWIAAAALLALAPAALGLPRMGRRAALLERAMDRLQLSVEQRSQVESVLAEHRAELRRQIEAVRDSREAQFAAVHGQPFDEGRIRAAAAAVGAAQADLAVTRARIASAVRGVLSAEQRARLDEMLETVRALAGGGRDRRERPGP